MNQDLQNPTVAASDPTATPVSDQPAGTPPAVDPNTSVVDPNAPVMPTPAPEAPVSETPAVPAVTPEPVVPGAPAEGTTTGDQGAGTPPAPTPAV